MANADSAAALNEKGERLFLAGDHDEAEAAFRQALECDEGFASAYNNMGVLCWSRGEVLEATDYLVRAMELAPTDKNIVMNCGEVLAALGRHEDARALYEAFLSGSPDDVDVNLRLISLAGA